MWEIVGYSNRKMEDAKGMIRDCKQLAEMISLERGLRRRSNNRAREESLRAATEKRSDSRIIVACAAKTRGNR